MRLLRALYLLFCLLISAMETASKRELSNALERVSSTLSRLRNSPSLPSKEEYKQIRAICQSRKHWDNCLNAFDLFRSALIPIYFPHRKERGVKKALKATLNAKSDGIPLKRINIAGVSKKSTKVKVLKRLPRSEDARFGDDSFGIGSNFMIVSDGVGMDADSRYFSRSVVALMGAALARIDPSDSIKSELIRAVETVQNFVVDGGLPAAATLSFIYVAEGGELWIGTLGDSEVMVTRDNTVLFHSPTQRNGSAPGQLNSHNRNAFRQISLTRIQGARGDKIIMATDGLWDNLHPAEVLQVLQDDGTVRKMAKTLVKRAVQRRKEKRTHIACNGRKIGGRKDDTTVLLAEL